MPAYQEAHQEAHLAGLYNQLMGRILQMSCTGPRNSCTWLPHVLRAWGGMYLSPAWGGHVPEPRGPKGHGAPVG